MSRPYVTISINNEIEDFLKHLESKMPKFKSFPGVIGITLNGGLSRGFADHLSEIDITFYLDNESFKAWHNQKTPIPLGIVKFDNVLYDIKIINYEEEDKRKYGDIELWDLSYSKILFDPNNKIANLFKDKLSTRIDISKAVSLLWESYWTFKLAGNIWINRADPLQGHFVLNESIKPLIKSLFIVNKEHIPHEKWLAHMSYSLDWIPDKWKERLMKAMNTESFTVEGVKHRQLAIEDLWSEINDFINVKWYHGFNLSCHQKLFYDLLKQLVKRKSIPVNERYKMADLSVLNMEPFHKITEICGHRIILNKERLLALKSEDLYSWHYEIVRGVITDLNLI